MLYNIIIIIIIFSVNYVVYTLRCHGDATCRFIISFNESFPPEHLWPKDCRFNIKETDIKQCSCYFEVDYETQTTEIRLEADPYMYHLYNSLGTNSPITTVALSNYFHHNKRVSKFTVSSRCYTSTFCIIDEIDYLLQVFSTRTSRSLNVWDEIDNLLFQFSPATALISCFNSQNNTSSQCSGSKHHNCLATLPQWNSSVDAICDAVPTADDVKLKIRSSYIHELTKLHEVERYWTILCNQSNCNSKEVYTKVIDLSYQFIYGPSKDIIPLVNRCSRNQFFVLIFIIPFLI
ncbi:unnamed protein product [Adineta steineri]|uniref:Uncharacterized protein n=1 Tax=Adineta steineri TaxID=433720 RepID=A0A818ISW9_9BILA|nr:unnamed protein product [Adineta steineri]